MWLILTVLCAIATFVSVLYFQSLVPAFVFLGLSIVFLGATWQARGQRK